MHKLEDENEELRDLLTQEEDRAESLEKLANDHLTRAQDAESHIVDLEQDLQAAEQELSMLRVCLSISSRLLAFALTPSRPKQVLSEM